MNSATRSGSRLWWASGAAVLSVVAMLVVVTQSWAGATQSEGERPVLVPISPCRLADTRNGGSIGHNATLQPAGTITIAAHGTNGQCTLPTDAVALSLNVTSVAATAGTYLTIWDDGPMPNASSLNPAPGQPPTPNAVTTPLSASGGFNVYNFAGTVDIIVDVNGYFAHHDHDDRYDTSAEVDAKIAAHGGGPGPAGPKGDPGQPGPKGDPGPEGLSAYEVAREQGYRGTEHQWLVSLIGRSCSVTDNGNNTGMLSCDDGTSVVIPTLSVPPSTITEILDAAGDGTGNTLTEPQAVAVDGSGNAYVTGRMSHNVFEVTPAGVITEIIDATGDGSGNTLNHPKGVAVDGSGNVFVAGGTNLFKVTPGGTITEILDFASTFDYPLAVAVDGSGNVYVSTVPDFGSGGSVFKRTPAGAVTEIIDATGDGTGNTLDYPQGLAVDGSGTVYVAGGGSHNVFEVTPAGAITEIIDATGDGTGNTLSYPKGVAVDGAGNVYVTGGSSHNVFEVTPAGVITEIMNAGGDFNGNPLSSPRGVAVDGAGNVYVIGNGSDNAFRVTPGGVITEIIDAAGDRTANFLYGPVGVAVSVSGDVYVTGQGSNNAFEVTPP